jgi:hypothetical protein
LKNGKVSEVANEPRPRLAIRLDQEAGAAREAGMGLLGDLEIVVVEADGAEAQGHGEHDPDIGIGRIGPQQGRGHDAEQDHQPAHGGRTLLGHQMGLRPVAADRLALALLEPQVVDDPGSEQEDEHQRGDHGPAGAKRDVAKHVEDRDFIGKVDQQIKHWDQP